MNTEAGSGEHHVYRIRSSAQKSEPLQTGRHYIGIDAVAWFINRKSSWFSSKMASGSLSIVMANGLEKYQAALGTFDLKGGARFAPVFEKPVLQDRCYRGGSVTLQASLTGIKRDTVLAGLLKNAANASLGIISGMVETASLAVPTKLLAAAGDEIVRGVQEVLTKTGEDRMPLFDFSGLQYSLQPGDLDDEETYLLLHRGSELDESQLHVKEEGQLVLPFYGSVPLSDGAWLMLRIRKSTEYSGVRPWTESMRELRARIESIVTDVRFGVTSKEDALRELRTTAPGSRTVYDKFTELRATIQNDGVLSEMQAAVFVGQLTATLSKALEDLSTAEPVFAGWAESVRNAVLAGDQLPDETVGIIAREVQDVAESRHMMAPESEFPEWTKGLQAENVQAMMSNMPRTLDINFGEL